MCWSFCHEYGKRINTHIAFHHSVFKSAPCKTLLNVLKLCSKVYFKHLLLTLISRSTGISSDKLA